MSFAPSDVGEELTLSRHTSNRRLRRERELADWIELPKRRRHPKRLALFEGAHVDAEMLPALRQMRLLGVETEFSCAGVSLRDEPEEHSLYAYVTVHDSKTAQRFIQWILRRMKHRIIVTYEPARKRYDISSFRIAHNRSFCFLLAQLALRFPIDEEELEGTCSFARFRAAPSTSRRPLPGDRWCERFSEEDSEGIGRG